jgi:hypothetical protein
VLGSPIGVTDGKAASSGWLKLHVRIEPERCGHRGTQDLRPLLLSIAYGIVGSVSEAADIVQEAFLHRTGNRVRMRTRAALGLGVHGHDAAGDRPAALRGHQGGVSRSQACCTVSSASLSEPSIR